MGLGEHQRPILHPDLLLLWLDLHQNCRAQRASSHFFRHVRYFTTPCHSRELKFLQHPQEFADISENVFKEYGSFSLIKVLNDPKILPHFISLSITDQPAERPTLPLLPEEREKHVIVKFSVPSGSQVEDTKEFFASLFKFVDIVGTKLGSALRPDTKNKLKKVREDLYKQLKTEATKERKEEVCLSSSTLQYLLRKSPFRPRMRSVP